MSKLSNIETKFIADCDKIDKPWGYEVLWGKSINSNSYAAKLLHINPESRLSLQYHEKKEETIYVMMGALRLWTDDSDDFIELKPGTIYHVVPGQVHRFGAGSGAVMLMEVSTAHLDDVVRIKDDYAR